MASGENDDRAHAAFLEQKSFGALDALRCLAIVSVVWHHSGPFVDYLPISSRGFLGVDLFFVISGFLIVTLLLREKSANGDISIRNFYIRRSLRIFPLYYGMVFLLLAYFLFVNPSSNVGKTFVQDIWIYLTYTGNFFVIGWTVVWSLAAEEQFYLVWPQVERYLSHLFLPIMIVAISFNQLFNFPDTRAAIGDWLGYAELSELAIVQVTFTPILLGVLLAHLLHDRNQFNLFRALFFHRYASTLWLVALFVIASIPNSDISGLHRLSIHLIMFAFVGSCVVREDHILMPLLRNRLVVRIGLVSYGVYIFHTHALHAVESVLYFMNFYSPLAKFVLGLGASVLAAELSFRYFESWFLRLKRRFSRTSNTHI